MFRILFFLVVSLCSMLPLNAQQPQRKVVFIIADGIPADVLENVNTPNLDKIKKAGFYNRAFVGGEIGTYTQTPTISAPGYMSLITGTWGYKHQVWDNKVDAPNYHYKNLFRLLKEQQPEKTIGIFSTWLDNRTKLVGEGIDTAGDFQFDFKYDGYELDTIAFPHDKNSFYTHLIDERVISEAAACIRKNAPDLSWIYLQHTDDMGHRYGDSEQMDQAVKYLDKQVGEVWEAITYRKDNFKEEWLIVITTDHGRDAETGKNHGGQSDRERATWMIMNGQNANPYFKNEIPSVVDIYPTITRFMRIEIPKDEIAALDGVPLTGAVSIYNPQVKLENNELIIKWTALEKEGVVKVAFAVTNNYKTGGKDAYRFAGKFPVNSGFARIPVGSWPSNFYKIVLTAPHNTVNRWVIAEKQ